MSDERIPVLSLESIPTIPSYVDEAYAEGYDDGIDGLDCISGYHPDSACHAAYVKGHSHGSEHLMELVLSH
jgi:hypothetical protein